MVERAVEKIPVAPVDVPPEQWSHAELLSDLARTALIRMRGYLERRVEADDWREDKAIFEVAAAKLYATVQVAQLRTTENATDWNPYMRELKREARRMEGARARDVKPLRPKKHSSQARK